MAQLHNPHPGDILKEEFLNTIGMSQNQLAHAIGVPGNRIHAIINGTRAITADTDLRLCKFFALSEGYFLRLQNTYDTVEAKRRIAVHVASDRGRAASVRLCRRAWAAPSRICNWLSLQSRGAPRA